MSEFINMLCMVGIKFRIMEWQIPRSLINSLACKKTAKWATYNVFVFRAFTTLAKLFHYFCNQWPRRRLLLCTKLSTKLAFPTKPLENASKKFSARLSLFKLINMCQESLQVIPGIRTHCLQLGVLLDCHYHWSMVMWTLGPVPISSGQGTTKYP